MSGHLKVCIPYPSRLGLDSRNNSSIQKRKRDNVTQHNGDGEVDTSRPSAVFVPSGGRQHTLSMALPGSVIAK